MGRNSAAQVHWTHSIAGTSHAIDWYCQQHAKYDHISTTSIVTSTATLKAHLEDQHGCVEQ